MIIRIWTYSTVTANAARFEEFEQKVGLAMMLSQPGCLGAALFKLRPGAGENSGLSEYVIISRWESWEQLKTALESKSWKDEIELFLAQGFGEGNGSVQHFDLVG